MKKIPLWGKILGGTALAGIAVWGGIKLWKKLSPSSNTGSVRRASEDTGNAPIPVPETTRA